MFFERAAHRLVGEAPTLQGHGFHQVVGQETQGPARTAPGGITTGQGYQVGLGGPVELG